MSYRRRKVRWFRLLAVVLGLPALLGGAFGFSYWSSRQAPTSRPAAEAPAKKTPVRQEFQRISVYAQNENLKDVLARIESEIGRSIVVGPRIYEKITCELVLVPWPEALMTVTQLASCELKRQPDGSFLVSQEPKVTFFRDGLDLREALNQLAQKRDKRIVIPKEIQGPLSIDLIAVSWDEAMRRVLKEAGPYTLTEDDAGRYVVTREAGR